MNTLENGQFGSEKNAVPVIGSLRRHKQTLTKERKSIMQSLSQRIRESITFDNSYDDTPGFVETCWFRWITAGIWRSASPLIFGKQVVVKNIGKTEHIHVFWAVRETFQFDDTSCRLVDGKAKYAETPFLPQPGDRFAYGFDGIETLFEVSSVSHESESLFQIEAGLVSFPL